MGILKDQDKEKVAKYFDAVKNPVKVVMFTQDFECEYCTMTREMVEDLAGLSNNITSEIHDFVKDPDLAKKYNVDKIPATIVMGDKDYGIRFYGVPAGYEFMTLIETIIDVGKREHGLPANVVSELNKVDQSVRMQVMISPT